MTTRDDLRPDPAEAVADEQAQAERLGEDVLGIDDVDHIDGDATTADYPPDAPMGATDRAVTPAGEQVGESAAQRAAREVPEGTATGTPPDRRVGEPVDPATDPDIDASQRAASEAEQVMRPGPEASALHLTDPPPAHEADGYLDDDR